MPLQGACGAERQVRNRLPNRAPRAQPKVLCTEYSATFRADVICREYWYPAKGTASVVNQGGIPDRGDALSGVFFYLRKGDKEYESEIRLPRLALGYDGLCWKYKREQEQLAANRIIKASGGRRHGSTLRRGYVVWKQVPGTLVGARPSFR